MTKSEFLVLVHQGWFKLGLSYHQGDFFADDYNSLDPNSQPSCACAMGAAAYADGGFRDMRQWLLKHNLIVTDTTYQEITRQIYLISDAAGSKEKAYADLEEKLPSYLFPSFQPENSDQWLSTASAS